MYELACRVPVEGFHLEALHGKGLRSDVAVLCHPHPLYGGDMDNQVVCSLLKVLWKSGWGTLRFNFRGVGASGGEYGEGEGEAEDVLAVASYLEDHGAEAIHLAGYSFGAWVALKAVRRGLRVGSLLLVSPPLDLLSFNDLLLPSRPCLVTLGDRDGFCGVGSLREWVASRATAESSAEVKIFPGCDHFYWGFEEPLSTAVADFVERRIIPHAVRKTDVPAR